MNCNIHQQAAKTIALLEAMLTPGYFNHRYRNAIDSVLHNDQFEGQPPISHEDFLKTVSHFTRIAYETGLHLGWALTDVDSQVVFLLRHHYHSGKYGRGYEAALLDANDPMCGGMGAVLQELAGIIRNVEYQKHIHAVFCQYLFEGDWYLLCEIARQLQQAYGPTLPESLTQCPPPQLVDLIPFLLMARVENQSLIQQFVS